MELLSAMRIILITLLISVPPLFGISCTRHLENTCGKYCFDIVKPILEHSSALQKSVDSHQSMEKTDSQKKWEKIESHLLILEEKVAALESKKAVLQKEKADSEKGWQNIENQLSSLQLILEEKVAALESKVVKPVLEFTAVLQKEKADSEKGWQNIENQLSSLQTAVTACKLNAVPNKKLFEKIGTKYYFIENEIKMNWHAAGERCNTLGGHLISLQNKKESDVLASRLKPIPYWTDINDIDKEGEFLSRATHRKAPFLNFAKPEPNNYNDEDCVIIRFDMKMNDFPCHFPVNFICEWNDFLYH